MILMVPVAERPLVVHTALRFAVRPLMSFVTKIANEEARASRPVCITPQQLCDTLDVIARAL